MSEPKIVTKARSFWGDTKQAIYIGGIVVGMLIGAIEWYRKNFPPVQPATSSELSSEMDQLSGDIGLLATSQTLYMDSLKRLRMHIDTTLIAPGLMAIVDLQRRMARQESRQVETRLAVEETKRQGAQGTNILIAQMNRQASVEERAKASQEQRDEQQRERDRALMEAIAKKLKINTANF